MTPTTDTSPDRFLPTTRVGMQTRGWDALDFLCITGDAYVDHPSFGHAIVSRYLEALGFRVGVLAQPDWKSRDDFTRMGRPRLAVLVAAGNLDSMLANYVSPGKKRRKDAYAPGGVAGRRADRATIAYCNRVRELWKDVPLVIGGIEASLRRMAHYDYWSNDVRRSVLVDSRADLLIYGMAETQLRALATALNEMRPVADIREIPGTCWKTHRAEDAPDAITLPSFEEVRSDTDAFAQAYKTYYEQQNFAAGKQLLQDQSSWFVVQNPPPAPLTQQEMDEIYALPFARAPHPDYAQNGVPAFEEVRFGITSHRGCFGECSFCAISSHQGRVIQSRSVASIVREARIIAQMPDFKGYIHDIGGPSANFRVAPCKKSETQGACTDKSCLYPAPCENLRKTHADYLHILKTVRELPDIKKVFVRSGLRYDYILCSPDGLDFLQELCQHHVSGQLKIAPEHCCESVLSCMRKASAKTTQTFIRHYREINRRLGKKQFMVPYFMSAHPGSDLQAALQLAEFIRDLGVRSEQVQDFTPTPGTVSTCMYYTGKDPFTGKKTHIPRDREERELQRALLQYWMPCNRHLVKKALHLLGRKDLIGTSGKCLIRP